MGNKFSNVRDAKFKKDIFIGPQVRELMQGKQFDEERLKGMHDGHLRGFARNS